MAIRILHTACRTVQYCWMDKFSQPLTAVNGSSIPLCYLWAEHWHSDLKVYGDFHGLNRGFFLGVFVLRRGCNPGIQYNCTPWTWLKQFVIKDKGRQYFMWKALQMLSECILLEPQSVEFWTCQSYFYSLYFWSGRFARNGLFINTSSSGCKYILVLVVSQQYLIHRQLL